MKTKRFNTAFLAMTLCCFAAVAQEQPQTKLTFQVNAVQESFFAGPYAKYAQKYLGVDAKEEDYTKTVLSSIRLSYDSDSQSAGSSFWSAPSASESGFDAKGVNANYTSEATTLYSAGMSSRIAVSQNMVVEKSLEQKAREAADMVFSLRKNRIQIITGDTDATYSGEAMKAAIDELQALEQEYLSLFLGYSESQNQTVEFELTPSSDPDNQICVLFRLSDEKGIVPADEVGGRPYYMDITVSELASASVADPKAASKAKSSKTVRIPAVCDVKVSDGSTPILQNRILVYQLGQDRTYPAL